MKPNLSCVMQQDKVSGNEIDLKLLDAIAQGDSKAFESLYKRYFKKLVGFAARTTGRSDLAEDIALESMTAIWRNAKSFSNRSRVSTWIFGIAYRVAMKTYARNKSVDHWVELDDIPDTADGMEDLEQIFLRNQLGKALKKLSMEQRSVMELTYYYGYTYPEIGEILECPVGTVKTRMMHARENMKKILSAKNIGH